MRFKALYQIAVTKRKSYYFNVKLVSVVTYHAIDDNI